MIFLDYWFDQPDPCDAQNEPVCVFQLILPTGRARKVRLRYDEVEHQIQWHERMLGQVRSHLVKQELRQAVTMLKLAKNEWPLEVSEQKNQTKPARESQHVDY